MRGLGLKVMPAFDWSLLGRNRKQGIALSKWFALFAEEREKQERESGLGNATHASEGPTFSFDKITLSLSLFSVPTAD